MIKLVSDAPPRPAEPSSEEKPQQRLESLIPEMLRRTFYAGLGAVFASEEGIRRLAAEFSLPKEAAKHLMHQAQSTKDEMFRSVATEVRAFLQQLHLSQELRELLTSLSFEIKTEIRFIPNEGHGVRPRTKQQVNLKRPTPAPRKRRARQGASVRG